MSEIRDTINLPQASTETINTLSKLVPMIETFGQVWRSSQAEHLTEPEAEYVLEVRKYVYSRHLVLHVRITNTLSDIWLRNATLLCVPSQNEASVSKGGLTQVFTTSLDVLGPGETKDLLVGFAFNSGNEADAFDSSFPLCKLVNTLKFSATEDVEDFAGYEDDFQVETVTLGLADYFLPENTRLEIWENALAVEIQKSFKSTRFRNTSGK
jgi:hypothetical protein